MIINKQLSFAVKLLPFVFCLHNFEEAWAISGKSRLLQSPLTINTTQFIIAVLLFSIFGFLIVFARGSYKTSRAYKYTTTAFAGMLFLNCFFPHIFSAIYLKSYTPGVITAVCLLLPLTSWILWKIYKLQIFSNGQLSATILSGGGIGMILVFLFLWIGSLFSW